MLMYFFKIRIIVISYLKLYNNMKHRTYQTVRIIKKSKKNKSYKEIKSIHLTHTYMATNFPGLVHTFLVMNFFQRLFYNHGFFIVHCMLILLQLQYFVIVFVLIRLIFMCFFKVHTIKIPYLKFYNETKNRKYQTVRIILKSNTNKSQKESTSVTMTHIYMAAHFPPDTHIHGRSLSP